MLRASGQANETELDLSAITDGNLVTESGVPHGQLLVSLAEAIVGRDEETLALLRPKIIEEVGAEQLVDAIAVAGNFQRMVRIADGTGIPLDKFAMQLTADIRAELGLDYYDGAQNTPKLGWAARATLPRGWESRASLSERTWRSSRRWAGE